MRTAPAAMAMEVAAIEDTIASGLPLLRFPQPLEALFEVEAGGERCRRLVFRNALALLIFDLFLVADAQVLPDILPIAILLRLAVVTPFAVMLIIVLWFEPPGWLRESIGVVTTVGAVAATLGLMVLSRAPDRDEIHHAIILAVLFVTVVQRLRFPYAVAACLVCFALQAWGLSALDGYSHGLPVTSNLILGTGIVLSLSAAYALERDSRLAYLVSLRDRLRTRELTALSLLDPLTGLANRRALDDRLAEMDRYADGIEELAVLLFDIDHFKLYNDSLGHQAGDACLTRIAGTLHAGLRESGDSIFRFGGEEFLVLLPGANLAEAVTVAERIRRAVEAVAIPHPAPSVGQGIVTVSVGAASAILGHHVRSNEIIAGADAALYAAKRNGRNQVWPPLRSAVRAEIVGFTGRGAASGP